MYLGRVGEGGGGGLDGLGGDGSGQSPDRDSCVHDV